MKQRESRDVVWGKLVAIESGHDEIALVGPNTLKRDDPAINCQIYQDGFTVTLTDLSEHGTYLEKEKIGKGNDILLRTGDCLYFAKDHTIGYIIEINDFQSFVQPIKSKQLKTIERNHKVVPNRTESSKRVTRKLWLQKVSNKENQSTENMQKDSMSSSEPSSGTTPSYMRLDESNFSVTKSELAEAVDEPSKSKAKRVSKIPPTRKTSLSQKDRIKQQIRDQENDDRFMNYVTDIFSF